MTLNGGTVLAPDDFKGKANGNADFAPRIERPVTLRAGTNQITVELRSQPGPNE